MDIMAGEDTHTTDTAIMAADTDTVTMTVTGMATTTDTTEAAIMPTMNLTTITVMMVQTCTTVTEMVEANQAQEVTENHLSALTNIIQPKQAQHLKEILRSDRMMPLDLQMIKIHPDWEPTANLKIL